jgi:hypothetical protein
MMNRMFGAVEEAMVAMLQEVDSVIYRFVSSCTYTEAETWGRSSKRYS